MERKPESERKAWRSILPAYAAKTIRTDAAAAKNGNANGNGRGRLNPRGEPWDHRGEVYNFPDDKKIPTVQWDGPCNRIAQREQSQRRIDAGLDPFEYCYVNASDLKPRKPAS
jgi:hypothetical protein